MVRKVSDIELPEQRKPCGCTKYMGCGQCKKFQHQKDVYVEYIVCERDVNGDRVHKIVRERRSASVRSFPLVNTEPCSLEGFEPRD
jgi:hypothetical protein